MSSPPRAGEPAPPFEGVDQRGRPVSSKALEGTWVVLYFYPKDETVGCTREACGFRDRTPALRGEDATVIGVSRDPDSSHAAFARAHGLDFPLLSDEGGELAKAYGVRGILGLPRRMTFLIDPHGRVAKVYRVRRWRNHSQEVLRDIRSMKRDKKAQELADAPARALF